MIVTNNNQYSKNKLDESMVPAINVIFLLLIFFMLAGHIEATNDQLKVSKSISHSDLKTESNELQILANGKIIFNSTLVSGNLVAALKKAGISKDSSLICAIHHELPASALDPVLKAANELGLKKLELMTELSH